MIESFRDRSDPQIELIAVGKLEDLAVLCNGQTGSVTRELPGARVGMTRHPLHRTLHSPQRRRGRRARRQLSASLRAAYHAEVLRPIEHLHHLLGASSYPLAVSCPGDPYLDDWHETRLL